MQDLSDQALTKLSQLCEGELSHVLHSQDFIRGLVFAVCASPEIPMPEQWLVWVFNQRGQLSSNEQADGLTDVLMTMMQNQLREMRDEQIRFPAQYCYEEKSGIPASEWLSGLLAGHGHLEQVWQKAWNRMANKQLEEMAPMQRDLKHCLMMFTTFADVPMAIKQAEQKNNHALVTSLPKIFHSIEDALKKYVGLSGALVSYMPDQFETFVQETP